MKKYIAILIAVLMVFSFGATAFAAEDGDLPENIPQLNGDAVFPRATEVTEEDGYIITSEVASPEEIALGNQLQELHTDISKARHVHLTAHEHSIRNISTSTKYYDWHPTDWTRNDAYPNSADWPTITWTTGTTTSASVSVSTSVGVSAGVVTASVGSDFTKSHTISTSTARTFKVPYKKDGRIKVTFNRPYKTFTCVTKYYPRGVTPFEEIGRGNASGKPANIVTNIQTRNI